MTNIARQDNTSRIAERPVIPKELLKGRTIANRYQLYGDTPISVTSNSRIFKAWDQKTGNDVAIKELNVGAMAGWKADTLFRREAETLKSIDHPRIIRHVDTILDEGTDEVRIVTEWLEGKNLLQLQKEGRRFSDEEIISIMVQLLDALAYLHALNPKIVHRDVKPENIMLNDDGTIKLVDFGFVATDKSAGTSVVAINNFGFTAPEITMGKRGTPKSDIFSAGALYLWFKTGRNALESCNEDGHYIFDYPELSEKDRAIFSRTLTATATARFSSGEELKNAILETRKTETALAKVSAQKPVVIDILDKAIEQKKRDTQATTIAGLFITGAAGYIAGLSTESNLIIGGIVLLVLLVTGGASESLKPERKKLEYMKYLNQMLTDTTKTKEEQVNGVVQEINKENRQVGGTKGILVESAAEIAIILERVDKEIHDNFPINSQEVAHLAWRSVVDLLACRRHDLADSPERKTINEKIYVILAELIKPETFQFIKELEHLHVFGKLE